MANAFLVSGPRSPLSRPRLRRLVDPPLRVLIRDGKVDHRNLGRCGLTRADVDAVLRQHGQRSPDRVQLAVYEEKGLVSVPTSPD